MPCARCSSTPAAPTPPPANAAWTTPPRRRAPPRSRWVCSPRRSCSARPAAISQLLPVEPMLNGILAASRQLRREGDVDFQQAIQTTDAFEKRANLAVELPSGTVHLTAQCKGAGMISPNFATMLCFVQTDAALQPPTAELLLGVCVKRSFDRCTVDGQLSTNDTAVLMASGASGVTIAPESEDELRFGEALDALLRQLAIMMVADGEGARADRPRGRARRAGRSGEDGSDGGGRGARGRQLAAGENRPARRRPQLGEDRPGGGSRLARRRAAAGGPLDRGHPRVLGRHGDRLRRGGARARGAGAGDRVRDHPPRRWRRNRGLLLRPLARVRTDQRGVHDMR